MLDKCRKKISLQVPAVFAEEEGVYEKSAVW